MLKSPRGIDFIVHVTPVGSRSDLIGGSELSPGRDTFYTVLYTGTLIDLFFLRVVPVLVVYKQFL